jgi:O-antigen biosynthesis protein
LAELAFPRVERPLVSIVLPTFDNIEWIGRALQACLDNTDPCYELILVDNGSTDGTKEFLVEHVSGATIITNERNYGAGVGTNLGASHAIGQYLFFLDSDALVQPGWLPPLLAILESDRTVAAAGSRLLNLDGSLQLAGALLTRAGATVVYGDGDDPGRPEYGFRRDVDFLAGAALLVRQSRFAEVGGFDAIFGHIYFEDVDLCLALHQLGDRVVYEPASTVIHVGGGGTKPSPSVLQLATRNRSLVERRWRALLASYPPAPLVGERRTVAARDIRSSDRILVLEDAACASSIASSFPSARVTLAAVEADARNLNPTIEVCFNLERTVLERRFHYDAVIGDLPFCKRFTELLLRMQPQAVQINMGDLHDERGEWDPLRLSNVVAAVASSSRPGYRRV